MDFKDALRLGPIRGRISNSPHAALSGGGCTGGRGERDDRVTEMREKPGRRHRAARRGGGRLGRLAGGAALLVALAGGAWRTVGLPEAAGAAVDVGAGAGAGAGAVLAFTPPPEEAIPAGPDGDAIRRGKALFENPGKEAAAYVGNAMACRNCHLDAGRRPFAAPMWAAWGVYPKYRAKNGRVVTMEERIRDCFLYSMNAPASPSGGPPPAGSALLTDMQAYFHWLATGAPSGAVLKGGGFLPVPRPADGADRLRGRAVYAEHCAACHGAQGEGMKDADGTVLFPPLWGAESYNWGAGMARLDRAAPFIKANMPQGSEGSLTDRQAWDVAAWIDSQERPADPRQSGSVAEAAKAHHAGEDSFYGVAIDGHVLGEGTAPVRRR